jgi:hypothetical protein
MTANSTHEPSDLDVQVIQGGAPKLFIYRADAGELERLTKGSNPLPLTVAGLGIGAFFSLLPTVGSSLANLGKSFSETDLIYTFIDGVSFIVGVFAAIYAFTTTSDAKKALKTIKARAE